LLFQQCLLRGAYVCAGEGLMDKGFINHSWQELILYHRLTILNCFLYGSKHRYVVKQSHKHKGPFLSQQPIFRFFDEDSFSLV